MLTNKRFNIILACLLAVAVVFTCIFVANPALLGITAAAAEAPYLSKLFDKDAVQSINISMDEDSWQEMLDTAIEEQYFPCDLTINGETFHQVGIRPKGNSSLTMVANSEDTDRYSFKLKMDEYVDGQTYYGLSKFVINNMQGDATYMKEYLSYDLYEYMGVDSPAYAFADISVNGAEWGLYLAVEAVEEEFAARTYGADYGQLYKPESADMGGGFGGRNGDRNGDAATSGGAFGDRGGGLTSGGGMQMPQGGSGGMNGDSATSGGGMQMPQGGSGGGRNGDATTSGGGFNVPADGNRQMPPDMNGLTSGDSLQMPQGGPSGGMNGDVATSGGAFGDRGGGLTSGGGMQMPQGGPGGGFDGSGGGADLIYVDDEITSYNQIFDEAVFNNNSDADKQRVIASLKTLNTSSDTAQLEEAINVDEVLRYFAVNTVVVNLDSYVCSFKHNYYLYEDDGQLSIVPWDLNLSFAGFQSGSASDAVNFPIDTPVASGIELAERPLIGALLEIDQYKELYHDYIRQIVDEYFNSEYFDKTVDKLNILISEYVANDATAFYQYDQYTTAVETLKQYGALRAASLQGQLDGSIPSTYDAQEADSDALVDASSINISDMGSQGGDRDRVDRGEGFHGQPPEQMPDAPKI